MYFANIGLTLVTRIGAHSGAWIIRKEGNKLFFLYSQ